MEGENLEIDSLNIIFAAILLRKLLCTSNGTHVEDHWYEGGGGGEGREGGLEKEEETDQESI